MSKKEFKVTLMVCSILIVVLVALGLILFAVALSKVEGILLSNLYPYYDAGDKRISLFEDFERTKPLFVASVLCFFNSLAPAAYIVDLTKNVEKVIVKEEE